MNDFVTALMSTGMMAFIGMAGWFFKRFFKRLDHLIDTVGKLVTEVSNLKIKVQFLENKQGIVAREETQDGNGN